MKWEYRVRSTNSTMDASDLNSYGNEGYELVNIVVLTNSNYKYQYIFKRQKNNY